VQPPLRAPSAPTDAPLPPFLPPLAVTITEPFLSAATYDGAQCSYRFRFGVDTDLTIGGGTQEFTFRASTEVRGQLPGSCLAGSWL